MTLAPAGAEVLTVEFKNSLLATASGLRFLATASVLRAGKRLAFCSGEVRAIRESGEELVANMPSTIITKTVERCDGASAPRKPLRLRDVRRGETPGGPQWHLRN